MQPQKRAALVCLVFVLSRVQFSCSLVQSEAPTSTPRPGATKTHDPTRMFTPTPTRRPTRTPNFASIEPVEDNNARVQEYFELGYLETTEGRFFQYSNFKQEWAQLGWYSTWPLSTGPTTLVEDFFISARFKWSSAYRNADESGCGIVFASQENGGHYAVFLDRRKIIFLDKDSSDYFAHYVGLTRGSGVVNFNSSADQPIEANFTLIVTNAYAYVLVNEKLIGEYTLSQSKILKGAIGVSLLSGTNKDFGTRCEMTNINTWIPNE